MKIRHTHANGECKRSIVPPYILKSIARNGTANQRQSAQQLLALDSLIRSQRTAAPLVVTGVQGVGPPRRNRLVYTASNATNLPGTLVRSEGQGASGDIAVNEAYDGLGSTSTSIGIFTGAIPLMTTAWT